MFTQKSQGQAACAPAVVKQPYRPNQPEWDKWKTSMQDERKREGKREIKGEMALFNLHSVTELSRPHILNDPLLVVLWL